MTTGRKSMFTPETRQAIIQAVRGGLSNADVCKMASIGERTLYEWVAIGEACIENKPHRRKPRDQTLRAEFAQFAQQYKIAQAQGNLARISQINRAAQDMWTHQQTGAVRYTAPPPITWFNSDTGELVHDDPKRAGKPGEWQKQFSGEVWRHQRGEWQAAAWYLERSDPGNWGKRTFITLEHNIRIETVNRVILALVQAGLDPAEVFEDMIVEAEYETPELRPENPRPD